MAPKTSAWVAISAAILFLFVTLFPIEVPFVKRAPLRIDAPSDSKLKNCKLCIASRQNVWADLDPDEAHELLEFLYAGKNDLNLTRAADATAWDNHIAFVELLTPNKTDALDYINGDAAAPTRFARVSINNGSSEAAGIYQYMVGPLPPNEDTTIEPLLYPYNSGRNFVRNPLPNFEEMLEWFTSLGEELSDLIEDLLPNVSNPSHLKGVPPLMAIARPAVLNEEGIINTWLQVHGPGKRFDAWSLNPQGLYCKVKIAGRDASQWTVETWYYNGVFYNSTKEFRKAWKSPGFEKLPANIDGDWTAAEPNEPGLEARAEAAPIMVQPGGPRFWLDPKQRFVSWMGFTFFIATKQATGLSLWDVKFLGDQVVFEITLQEALAHYAGGDPMQSGMLWMDSMFGMGFNMYELVPGYDCPAYATYLSTSFVQKDQIIHRNNSICIFEYTSDHLIQRHTTKMQVTASRNTYLVVRSVSTVGNYDYTIDYTFYLDGTIEVKVRASGYIFGAYNLLESGSKAKRDNLQYDYGYQVHDHVGSSMHDHGISFKADLDVAGTANSLYRLDITEWEHQYAWDDRPRKTMHLKQNTLTTEDGFNWPPNANAMYLIVNNETSNKWGEKRGYRITPGTGMGTPPHLTIKDSPVLGHAAAWTANDFYVLQHHDTEHGGSSEYNGLEPNDPLIDFGKMVDGESIEQEDLVLYFTLGTHHISHSGDIPNTLMHTSATSVVFTPHNFHDRDPSRDSAEGVRLDLKGPGKGSNVTYFGSVYKHAPKLSLDDVAADLSQYSAPDESLMILQWNESIAGL